MPRGEKIKRNHIPLWILRQPEDFTSYILFFSKAKIWAWNEKDKTGFEHWSSSSSGAELLWQWQCCCTASSYSYYWYSSFANVCGKFPPHTCHGCPWSQEKPMVSGALISTERKSKFVWLKMRFAIFHGNSLGAVGKGPEFFLIFCGRKVGASA